MKNQQSLEVALMNRILDISWLDYPMGVEDNAVELDPENKPGVRLHFSHERNCFFVVDPELDEVVNKLVTKGILMFVGNPKYCNFRWAPKYLD